ncbi:glutamate-rich protein 5 isoform X1 [Zalophus californianus]|uniref:Glutamate-rich protein 5 isoform X1 n=1 Tax=Zalophus californianus TaxID=9704 RepID=A0A6J2B1E7_ZALCA|nr:glutamate-rich protein 5 isoform X1 [Zalophus californianus]XP_027425765.1 glutamate-rich protein 5 isoform X1 [Zalophus californianus]XP_027425774.1 glutamate-rich protein 5 isoform X1 [Zalophus californianus]XP_027425782.1 glutamate-rich protein 5 isoform X1 [Zalophus californianus]XP_027425792.1 glutamate-rich protein 5 isoform X1 [Zalophus californianus]
MKKTNIHRTMDYYCSPDYKMLPLKKMEETMAWLTKLSPRKKESESCFAQPRPHTLGKGSTLYGKVQKESPPPLEKLKIAAVSTANGVKSLHEQPLANDTADPPGSTEETQPLDRPEESGPPQPGGEDDTPGTGEKRKDMGAMTEAQPLKGNAETESVGTDTKDQPLRTTGERDSPGAVDGTENPQTAREMKPLGTAEKIPPLEAARKPQPQEAMGKGEQTQLPETVPKENESPEVLEGSQFVKTAEEWQLQETLGEDERSQPVETIPKENETPEVLEGSQFMGTAVNNYLLHKTPEGPGSMEQIQPEGIIVGSIEHLAGILEIGANIEMVRKNHTNEEDQHIEGETGEKVETEMENEKGSEGPGTKEEETGEAVDLSAAT